MEKNANFGHGVIWTIFERGLGIQGYGCYLVGGCKRAFRKFLSTKKNNV